MSIVVACSQSAKFLRRNCSGRRMWYLYARCRNQHQKNRSRLMFARVEIVGEVNESVYPKRGVRRCGTRVGQEYPTRVGYSKG